MISKPVTEVTVKRSFTLQASCIMNKLNSLFWVCLDILLSASAWVVSSAWDVLSSHGYVPFRSCPSQLPPPPWSLLSLFFQTKGVSLFGSHYYLTAHDTSHSACFLRFFMLPFPLSRKPSEGRMFLVPCCISHIMWSGLAWTSAWITCSIKALYILSPYLVPPWGSSSAGKIMQASSSPPCQVEERQSLVTVQLPGLRLQSSPLNACQHFCFHSFYLSVVKTSHKPSGVSWNGACY